MNDLDREFRGKGLQILGINLDKKPDDAKKFLGQHPANFTVAFDTGDQCPRQFDVRGMPSSYLIDRNGVIRYVHLGFRRGDAGELRGMVEELLAEKPAEHQP
jgi:peroxiredoxin